MNKILNSVLAINLLVFQGTILSCQAKTNPANSTSTAELSPNPTQPTQPQAQKRLAGMFVDGNSSAGTGADGKSWATAYKSIQEGVNAAQPGDRIYVAAGVYDDPAIKITDKKGVELVGGYKAGELYEKNRASLQADEWTTLKGDSGDCLVSITGASGDIHFNGGFIFRDMEYESAIHIKGEAAQLIENITISDSRFENNQGANQGAGILIEHAKGIHLNGLNASENKATASGGFIYAENVSGLSITGGVWHDNQATNSGGAIFVTNSSGINISGQEINGNKAEYGGGIHITGCQQDGVSLHHIKFNDNTVGQDGGAIAISDSNDLKMSHLEFAKNIAQDKGGAIKIGGSKNIELLSSTFTSNQSASSSGGAIYCNDSDGVVLFDGLTLSHNRAADGGGILFDNIAKPGMTISHSRFSDNIATGRGGAIVLVSADKADKFIFGNGVAFLSNSAGDVNGGGAIFLMFTDGDNAGQSGPQVVFQDQVSDIAQNTAAGGEGHFLSVNFEANQGNGVANIAQFIEVGPSGIVLHNSSAVHME